MTDDEMAALLLGQRLDAASPAPSIEALLHAFLPGKFVEHTHADAVLAIVDQPGSADLVREVWGDQAAFVPIQQVVACAAWSRPGRRGARPRARPSAHHHGARQARIPTWEEHTRATANRAPHV